MATNTHKVVISVSSMGADKVTKQIKGLKIAMAALAAAAAAVGKALVTATDDMTNLSNKAKVFARDNAEAANRMQTVVAVARKMHMPLDGVGDTMQRISMSADQVGLSGEGVTKMVTNLAMAVKLSGATSQEATGALRQFGQALAANRLSGQELNSILEQTPMIARVIADSMGVAVGELRALGKEGKITAEVMTNALGGTVDDLEEKFKKFEFPISDQLVSIRREMTFLMDSISRFSGFADMSKGAIGGMVDYLNDLNHSFATGGEMAQKFMKNVMTAFDVFKGAAIVVVSGLTAMKVQAFLAGEAFLKFAKAVRTFGLATAVLRLNPVILAMTMLGAVAVALIPALNRASDKYEDMVEPMSKLEQAQAALAAQTAGDAKAVKRWADTWGVAVDEIEEHARKLMAVSIESQVMTGQAGDVQFTYHRKLGESAGESFRRGFADSIVAQDLMGQIETLTKGRLQFLENLPQNITGEAIQQVLSVIDQQISAAQQKLTGMLDVVEQRAQELNKDMGATPLAAFSDADINKLAGFVEDWDPEEKLRKAENAAANLRDQVEKLISSQDKLTRQQSISALGDRYTQAMRSIKNAVGEAFETMLDLGQIELKYDEQTQSIELQGEGVARLNDLLEKHNLTVGELIQYQEAATEAIDDSAEAQKRLQSAADRTARDIRTLNKDLSTGLDPMRELGEQIKNLETRIQNLADKGVDVSDLTDRLGEFERFKEMQIRFEITGLSAASQYGAAIQKINEEMAKLQGLSGTDVGQQLDQLGLQRAQIMGGMMSENAPGSMFAEGFDIESRFQQQQMNLGQMRAIPGADQETIDLLMEYNQLQRDNEMAELENKTALFEMNQGLMDQTLTMGELSAGVTTAMAQGFEQVAMSALDLSGNIANFTAMAIGGLADEIATLATTGKANFKQLGVSFVQMLAQMIIKLTIMLAVVTAINAIAPGFLATFGMGASVAGGTAGAGASAAGGIASGGGATLANPDLFAGASIAGVPMRAAGGPVYGGEPILVGERGPELFVPPVSGSIKNNSATMGMQQQAPQVTVVNVDSTQNTLDALGSEEGEQIIMNVIQRNPEVLRTIG